jgi:PAT family beta-lactamase induction signal transducer AmpG
MSERTSGSSWATSPWVWIPTLYFVQGLPYSIVTKVTPVLYKDLGVSNSDITFWVSWLSILWALKAFWSPLIESTGTKRTWAVAMTGLMGPTLGVLAFTLPTPWFVNASLAFFLVLAFSSATYDVAADGFYMLGLRPDQQAAFVGVRSTFWRFALIAVESGLVMLAGFMLPRATPLVAPENEPWWSAFWRVLELKLRDVLPQTDPATAWATILGGTAVFFVVATAYHWAILPRPAEDRAAVRATGRGLREWLDIVVPFFQKPQIVRAIVFIFLYRFAENMMLSLVAPFMKDPIAEGGLGLDNVYFGFAKGFVGVLALLLGGVLGGLAINRHGLKAWLWPMVAIMHLPDLVFVWLAWTQPQSFGAICALIGLEQFGYGFGFTAYMVFLLSLADGPHKTAHYAIATGLMALAVTLTTMWTGALEEVVGYKWFFVLASLGAIPGVAATAWITVDPELGRKKA